MSQYPPQALPYETPGPYSRDTEHLRLIAIFHYVVGGLIALFSSCAIIHVTMGLMIAVNPQTLAPTTGPANPQSTQQVQDMTRVMGGVMAGIGGLTVLLGWAMGGLAIYSGRCIAKRRGRIFSLIMAGLMCLWIPLGTILGVFTFIVLLRPTVEAMYNPQHAA